MLQFSCRIIDKHQQTAFSSVLQTSHGVSHQFGSVHQSNPGCNEADTAFQALGEESTDQLQSSRNAVFQLKYQSHERWWAFHALKWVRNHGIVQRPDWGTWVWALQEAWNCWFGHVQHGLMQWTLSFYFCKRLIWRSEIWSSWAAWDWLCVDHRFLQDRQSFKFFIRHRHQHIKPSARKLQQRIF
jgi:hypothetical protein